MSEVYLIRRGGGAPLNFKITGGTTEPTSPVENTVWVNTSTAITSHVFSMTEPTNPVTGMVWINVGASSQVAMNVLDDGNELYVYPISCYQYISDAWVSKTAKSYIGLKWVEWMLFLYNSGNTFEDITGGWVTSGKTWSYDATSQLSPKITYESSAMIITHKPTGDYGSGGGIAYIKNKIDLTNFSMLRIEGSFDIRRITNFLGIWDSLDGTYVSNNTAATLNLNESFTDVMELDVSSIVGEKYIGFGFYNTTNTPLTLSITSIMLKP